MRVRFFIVFAVIVLSAMSSGWAQERVANLSIGDAAPPLDVTTIKGEPVNLRDGKGKNVVIVEFWATWCGPCRDSIPHLTALQKRYGDKGLVIIGISDEAPETIRSFVNKMGSQMDYTVAADKDRQTWRRYMAAVGAEGIPHAFVVDKSGSLIWHGHPKEPFMESLVSVLLSHQMSISPQARPSSKSGDSGSASPGTESAGSGPKS